MKTRKLKASSGGYLRIAKSKTYTTVPYTVGGVLFNAFTFTQYSKSPGSIPSNSPLFQKNIIYKGAYYIFVGKSYAGRSFDVVYNMPYRIRKLKPTSKGYITISETKTYKNSKIISVGGYALPSLPTYTTDTQIKQAIANRISYRANGKIYLHWGGSAKVAVEYTE